MNKNLLINLAVFLSATGLGVLGTFLTMRGKKESKPEGTITVHDLITEEKEIVVPVFKEEEEKNIKVADETLTVMDQIVVSLPVDPPKPKKKKAPKKEAEVTQNGTEKEQE